MSSFASAQKPGYEVSQSIGFYREDGQRFIAG